MRQLVNRERSRGVPSTRRINDPAPLGVPAVVGPEVRVHPTVNQPLELTVWAADDGIEDPRFPGRGNKPLNVRWIIHRQPVGATVKFAEDRPKVDRENQGKASTTATFSMPGDYVLRAQGTDLSGEGGGGCQCCWTSALVKVAVK